MSLNITLFCLFSEAPILAFADARELYPDVTLGFNDSRVLAGLPEGRSLPPGYELVVGETTDVVSHTSDMVGRLTYTSVGEILQSILGDGSDVAHDDLGPKLESQDPVYDAKILKVLRAMPPTTICVLYSH